MNLINAEEAIRKTAEEEGIDVEEVREEIQKAILIGIYSEDSVTRKKWRKTPCKGRVPTPEELIQYLAKNMKDILY